MNEILETEYKNTIGHYQTSTPTPSNPNASAITCSTLHYHNRESLEVSIYVDIPSSSHTLFRQAVLSFLKPHLLTGESIRCLLRVRSQRVIIHAACTPVTFHATLINKELEQRVLLILAKAKENKTTQVQ